jgi:hypothetical protein
MWPMSLNYLDTNGFTHGAQALYDGEPDADRDENRFTTSEIVEHLGDPTHDGRRASPRSARSASP